MSTPKFEAGNGYRFLNNDEIPLAGDEVYETKMSNTWRVVQISYTNISWYNSPYPITVEMAQNNWADRGTIYYRRKITINQNMSTVNIKPPAFILGNDFISLSFNGVPTTIYKQDSRFEKVIEIIKSKQWDKLECAINTAKAIAKFSAGKVEVFDGAVMYNGSQVKNAVVDRILEFMRSDWPYEPLVKFLDNLMQNPNEESRNQLYTFLERYKMPITDDGMVHSVKAIRSTFFDKYTNTVDNHVGQNPKVDRKMVSQDSNVHASFGLHTGWYNFVLSYGSGDDIAILVEFNPKDVCRIPNDCSYQKIVVCEYKVLKNLGPVKDIKDFESNYAPKTEQAKDLYEVAEDLFEIATEDVCDGEGENLMSNDDFIRSQKGKVTDTELRKIIRDTYNVKKTQGNAIFNRLFSGAKVAKTVKVEVKKNILSSNAAWEAYKSGNSLSNGKIEINGVANLITRDFIRKNKGWYII